PGPSSPLFPYTTLFRSVLAGGEAAVQAFAVHGAGEQAADGREQADVTLGELTPLSRVDIQDADKSRVLAGHRHGRHRRVGMPARSEEHTSELQSLTNLV